MAEQPRPTSPNNQPAPNTSVSKLDADIAKVSQLVLAIEAQANTATAKTTDIEAKAKIATDAAQRLKEQSETAETAVGAIGRFLDNAEVATRTLAEKQQKLLADVDAVQAVSNKVSDLAKAAEGSKSKVEEAATAAAVKSELFEKSRTEIDSTVSSARELVQTFDKQVEATKVTGGEIKTLLVALQDSSKQINDTNAQALQLLETIRKGSDGITEAQQSVATTKATIESLAENAAKRSAHIDDAVKYVDKSKAKIEEDGGAVREQLTQAQQQNNASKVALAEINTLMTATQTANQQSSESNVKATATLESIRDSHKRATDAATLSEALRTKIDELATVAATRSDHIEKGKIHADGVRDAINAFSAQAKQSAADAEAQNQASVEVVDEMKKLALEARASKTTVDEASAIITELKTQSEKYTLDTKSLADAAAALESRIKDGELRLAAITEESTKQLKQIESLLLGATNANLAGAFDRRSKLFKEPEKYWQKIFFASLTGIILLAAAEAFVIGNMNKAPDFADLARMLLHHLPFLVPLIWMAIYASAQAAVAKRLEEEYAFKATISTSFEGYRREMASIDKELTPNSPLGQLCSDTLRTICNPPGQLYDKHRMDPTPASATAELVKPIADSLAKAIEARLPKLPGS